MKDNTRSHTHGWQTAWPLCLIFLWLSCATSTHLFIEPVGPRSAATSGRFALTGSGFLKVYSATETRFVGKFDPYYPHTPYLIYDTNGNVVRWVQNALGYTDESPTLVTLP